METQSHKITVSTLQMEDVMWFVETAAVRMLTEELQRPELVYLPKLYELAGNGMDGGTAWVAKRGNEPVGALGSLLLTNPFNPSIVTLAEMFWWVDPIHRESRAGAMLLKTFEDRAAELADEATMSLLTTSSVQDKTLAKRGWFKGEVAFRKDMKWQR